MERFEGCDMKMVTFVTGSRRYDLLIFIVLACLVIATSYRLRVYYRVTVFEVSVVRVDPDGTRRALQTPEQFRKMSSADKPSKVIPGLESGIREYVSNHSSSLQTESGTRLEWTIRYSFNSRLLNEKHVIVFDSDNFEQP
jgi:hypothetical protein